LAGVQAPTRPAQRLAGNGGGEESLSSPPSSSTDGSPRGWSLLNRLRSLVNSECRCSIRISCRRCGRC
jgi:hypothetical protein